MQVAGLVPFTTIDFPGRLAAVLFLQGCPLRCPFCHNAALQIAGTPTDVSWDEAELFLTERTKRLDGIVLSGGEPLMTPDVIPLAKRIKEMGYQVAIHTSGVYPERLTEILPYIDWVGLDIKAPWDKYDLLTGRPHMAEKVQKSLQILLENNIDFEARTTCDPRYLTIDDIYRIGDTLSTQSVQTYILQHYRTFDGDINPPEPSAIESFFQDTKLQQTLRTHFPHFDIR